MVKHTIHRKRLGGKYITRAMNERDTRNRKAGRKTPIEYRGAHSPLKKKFKRSSRKHSI